MLNFTCFKCEKPIYGLTILIDETHFIHQECKNILNDTLTPKKTKKAKEHHPKKINSL